MAAASPAVTEPERRFGAARFDLVNAAALFALVGLAVVEHNAVARLDRRAQLDRHRLVGDLRHFTEKHTAFGAEAAVSEFLVVDAAEPTRVLAPRERHLDLVAGGGRADS